MRCFLLLCLIALCGCEEEDRKKVRDEPIGYRGEARLNPYLAAETYLSEKGWEVESSRTWSNYRYETAIIFMPASFLETKGMGIRVLDWVGDGGTLVLTLEGGEPDWNDFIDDTVGDGVPRKGDYSGLDHLFEEVGISADDSYPFNPSDTGEEEGHLSRGWEMTRTDVDAGDFDLEFEGFINVDVEDGWTWDTSNKGKFRIVEKDYGAGEVVVMAHARPFRNPYIGHADHADFLEYLAETYAYNGDIVFLYGSKSSFFGLLWKEGRMVVIGGLILLFAWLWMRIPRFGPVLKDNAVKRRPYGEALKASARFLWRSGQVEHLLRPLRASLERQNQGDPSTLYDRLAEESGLNREEVAEALTINPPKDPGHILKLVQKLQALLKR